MKNLFFSRVFLGALFLSFEAGAGKFRSLGNGILYDYDQESKKFSVSQILKNPETGTEVEEPLGSFEGVTASWAHNDFGLYSKVTLVLAEIAIKKELDLPYTLIKEDTCFMGGRRTIDGFEQMWCVGYYRRPDGTRFQKAAEAFFEKAEERTQESILERCVKTRDIFFQGHVKKEHYTKRVCRIETMKTIWRKQTSRSVPEKYKTTSSVDEILMGIPPQYRGSTTAGQPCPAGGCTGPHEGRQKDSEHIL